MKNPNSPSDDIKHIRQMMEESAKFLSLSGFSGVIVGFIAVIGATVAYFLILEKGTVKYDEYLRVLPGSSFSEIRGSFIFLGLAVLLAALLSVWYISYRKSKKLKVNFWTSSAKKMVYSLAVVLITGGIFCIIIIYHGYFKLVASVMLIFYGLALLNASKYSKHDIRSLAYAQILIGLAAAFFLNHGLLLWTIGFGFVHILYGILLYFKYESQD